MSDAARMSQKSDRTEDKLRALAHDWAAAEVRGDTALLQNTLTDDFVGVGPLGFMLSKEDWLQRHDSGDMKYDALDLDDMRVRVYGDAAVMVCRQTQRAKYRGQDAPGQFRETLIWVRQQGRWLLAGLHLSPIAQRP